jgi:hypothetical protein
MPAAELVDVARIWDRAPHNAFTDLTRYRGRWFCAFREGEKHASADGALRVLTSSDGRVWTSAALLRSASGDLRDPKLAITPDGQLMLTGASALHQPAAARHQTLAWFSTDGARWQGPDEIGEPDMWLWRVTWREAMAYGIAYNTTGQRFVRLYSSRDGRKFAPLVDRLAESGFPNESSILFLPDATALCLMRRETAAAQLGISSTPYRDWKWHDLGVKVGGPSMIQLPDQRIVGAGRLYDGKTRTALWWIDPHAGTLTEFLALPSGGDTSYPGMVWHQGLLWISYYSSHEGKTSIYLARVKIP